MKNRKKYRNREEVEECEQGLLRKQTRQVVVERRKDECDERAEFEIILALPAELISPKATPLFSS
jgi:hypothetical protein